LVLKYITLESYVSPYNMDSIQFFDLSHIYRIHWSLIDVRDKSNCLLHQLVRNHFLKSKQTTTFVTKVHRPPKPI